jgi:large subunit ribosomal protein L4e
MRLIRMLVNVYDLEGEVKESVELPKIFSTSFRPDLIRKAVSIAQSNKRQPYGPSPLAGKKHSEESWSVGRGVSRVPRLSQGRRAVLMPGSVGGRRAHPPRPDKKLKEKLNKKEARLAKSSALAATADKELVLSRNHKFNQKLSLPLVITDDFEKINNTKSVVNVLQTLGIWDDVCRSKEKKHIRPGKGKLRGRKYKRAKSLLLVLSEKSFVQKAARNLPGVDVAHPRELTVELLAPGADPGRLTLFTKSSLKKVGEPNGSL